MEKTRLISVVTLFLILSGMFILFPIQPSILFAEPPSTPNPDTWITNGYVTAIAPAGPVTYIGGNFTYVGPSNGSGARIDATTGNALPPYMNVKDYIATVAPDGSGGWYIGGIFSEVGGFARSNIAHILSDGTLDPSWNPNADYSVQSIAVSGNIVYVGGEFTKIGGQDRSRLAALDATTGLVTDWNPNANNPVYALAGSGGLVYV